MDLQKFSEERYEEVLKLAHDITVIPAPSHHEEQRAEFVLQFLKDCGVENAYMDEAKNVVCTLGKPSDTMTVFMAHTDTVFPMETPLDFVDDGENIRCPGVGDDTASLAVMLTCIKHMQENKIVPEKTLMFVANACEEGLGNLKGCRKIFETYGDKIDCMYTFDSKAHKIANKSVGSHRYRVTAITEGGHSFQAFGNRNAISVLSEIVHEIYQIEVPKIGNSCTTYNVGIIEGGTSVNTIAQSASMLCEYRSDHEDCLAEMKEKFEKIFEKTKEICPDLVVELVGERPCMSVKLDPKRMQEISEKVIAIQSKHYERTVSAESGSTDCNIPHSMAIPALALAVYDGGGTHTREEWVIKESLKPGLRVAMELILSEGEI